MKKYVFRLFYIFNRNGNNRKLDYYSFTFKLAKGSCLK